MPELLAIEWDDTQARLAVASQRGGRMVVEQAFAVDLLSGPAHDEQTLVDVGARIATELSARGIGRVETLVAVGRSSIELRQLSLPPAPENELPGLVRFQAMREFNELTDEWLLDFVPIGGAAEGPQEVLAAAIDSQLVGQIQQTCRAAGLKPRRLILRACAAASLLERVPDSRGSQARLLVDLLAGEADLTVMIGPRVAFLRTTRIAGDPPETRALLNEIRRTMAAAQNQLGGRRVESILLCGAGEDHAACAREIQESLQTPTELFDPFGAVTVGPRLRRALPEHPGRFAPLLGMLAAEAEGREPTIDFLHPRRPPEPVKRRRWYVAAAVAAAVVVFGFLVYRQLERNDLAAEIDVLESELDKWGDLEKRAMSVENDAAAVERWAAGDVVWLDELADLSAKAPPAREVMLTEMKLDSLLTGGGQVQLKGLAQDAPTIQAVEQRLRDAHHTVETGESSQNDSQPHYSWWFSARLTVEPEEDR